MAADAGGIRAGGAYVELGANDAKLQQVLDRAAARLQAWGSAIAGVGAKLAGIGTAGLTGLGTAVGQLVSVGDQLDKMSKRTGISVESLSQFRYVTLQSGTDLETFEAGIKKMQMTLHEASMGSDEAHQKISVLGTNLQELRGLTPQQQFLAFAQALSQVANADNRAAVATKIFGSAGTQLLPMLAGGAAGINAMREQAQALGVTMTADTAQGAAELKAALNAAWMQVQAVAINIGAALLPALQDAVRIMAPLVKATIDWVKANSGLVTAIAAGAVAVTGLGVALLGIGAAVYLAGAALGALSTVLGAAQVALFSLGGVVPLVKALGAGLMGVVGAIRSLAAASGAIAAVKAVLVGLGLLVKGVALGFGLLLSPIAAKIAAIVAVGAGLVALGRGVASWLGGGSSPSTNAGEGKPAAAGDDGGAAKDAEQKVGGIKGVAVQAWNAITTATGTAWSAVRSGAASAWQAVSSTAVTAFRNVKETAVTAWSGISAALKTGDYAGAFEIGCLAIQLTWSQLMGFLEQRWISFAGYFTDLWDDAVSLWNTGLDAVEDAWIDVTSFLFGDWESFTAAVSQAWDDTVGWISDAWEAFAGNLSAAWDVLGEAWAGVTATISDTWETTVGFLRGLWDGFYSQFKGVIDGMVGLWESLAGVIAKIAGPIKKALEPILSFFDSRVGRGILATVGLAVAPVSTITAAATGQFASGDPEENEQQRQRRRDDARASREDRDAARAAARPDRGQVLADADARRRAQQDDLQRRLEDRADEARDRTLSEEDLARREGGKAFGLDAGKWRDFGFRRKADFDAALADLDLGMPGVLTDDRRKRAAGISDMLVNPKVDVSGTFNAAGSFGLGGTTVAERITTGVKSITDKLDEVKREIGDNKGIPVV